jgi:hypothetical protein
MSFSSSLLQIIKMKHAFIFLGILLLIACGGNEPFDIHQSGGTRAVIKADPADMLLKLSGNSNNTDFLLALDSTRKMNCASDKEFLQKFRANFSQRTSTKLAMIFALADREKYKTSMSDDEVENILLEEFSLLRERAVQVILGRLEKAGCKGKNVEKHGEEIVVEVDTSISERNLRNAILSFATFRLYEGEDPFPLVSHFVKINEYRMRMGDTIRGNDILVSEWFSVFSIEPAILQVDGRQNGPPHAGFIRARDTSFFYSVLHGPGMDSIFPAQMEVMFLQENEDPDVLKVFGVRIPAKNEKVITEDHILSTNYVAPSRENPVASVNITFNDEGKNMFAELSGRNINQAILIVVNGKAIMAPVVMEKLTNGEIAITGGQNPEDFKELAMMFSSGSLPCRFQVMSLEKVR